MAQPGPPGGISGSSLFPLPLNPGADGLSPVARETAVALNTMSLSPSSLNASTSTHLFSNHNPSPLQSKALLQVGAAADRFTSLASPAASSSRVLDPSVPNIEDIMLQLGHRTTSLYNHVHWPSDGAFNYPDSLNGKSDLTGYSPKLPARPIQAALLALPATPGQVSLLEVLPPKLATLWRAPSPALFNPFPPPCGRPAFMIAGSGEWSATVRRLYDLGMVTFTTTQPRGKCGAFALDKDGDKQRLIIDCRPTNAVFTTPDHTVLTMPDDVARLQYGGTAPIYVAKTDICSAYHRFLLPQWMQTFFGLPPVRASDIGVAAEYGDVLLFPMCTTAPMGFSHSLHLVQASHMNIIDLHVPQLRQQDFITKANGYVLSSKPRFGVYVDDFQLFGVDERTINEVLASYIKVMNALQLRIKESKTQWATSGDVEVLGILFNGTHFTVGVHPQKLARLAWRIMQLLERRTCTGLELSSILGSLVWAFLIRRPALSILRVSYIFVHVAGNRVFSIWPSVARELRVAVGIFPLLYVTINALWAPNVLFFDASTVAFGVTSAPASQPHQATLAALPVRGQDGLPVRSMDPLLLRVATRSKVVVSSSIRFPQHINVLEARAQFIAIRIALSNPDSWGKRLQLFGDSMVVVGATHTGRSSSIPLNTIMRKAAPWLLVTRSQLYQGYIRTESNPADAPSRPKAKGAITPPPSGARLHGKEYSSDAEGDGPVFSTLALQGVAAKTRDVYQVALSAFTDYAVANGYTPVPLGSVDDILTMYTQHLFDMGKGRQQAINAIAAVKLVIPSLRRSLPQADRALRGWACLRPAVQRPPLTWDLAVVIAATLAEMGDLAAAAAVLTAFDTYMRLGEVAALKVADVAQAGDPRRGLEHNTVTLRLRQTKTGRNQGVQVRRPAVRHLLALLLPPGRSPNTPLFGHDAASLSKQFKKATTRLGLTAYSFHSLRHGGATFDHLKGVPLADIIQRGRWASTTAATNYVQTGQALLLASSAPPQLLKAARIMAKDVLKTLQWAAHRFNQNC